jgi:hypothetical protein
MAAGRCHHDQANRAVQDGAAVPTGFAGSESHNPMASAPACI